MIIINKFQIVNEIKELNEDRTIEMVGSTSNYDRVNDRMILQGAKIDNYLKNPVVLQNHDYHKEVIGKTKDIRVEGDKMIFKIEFANTEKGNEWYYLYKNKFMNASSIGFRSDDYIANEKGGLDFKSWELLEISLVTVPCNPQALQKALDEKHISKELYNSISNIEPLSTKEEDSEVIENKENIEKEKEEPKQEKIENPKEEYKMTEQEKMDFMKQITEMLSQDKNFGEVVRKIHIGNENPIDTKNMTKEEKTAKFFQALTSGDITGAKSISGSVDNILVPSEFRADVIDRVEKQPLALRNYCTVVPVNRRAGEIPVIDGGIKMGWADSDSETTSDKKSKPTFSSVEYAVHRLEGYTALAKDTVNDSPIALYQILLNLYSEALIQFENEAIVKGTGSKQPKGFLDHLTLTEITSKTFDEIIGLQYELPASKRVGAVYIASSKAVRKMRLVKGTDGKYLWENGNMADGQLPKFNGYNVLELDTVDTTGKNVVVFANMKDYYLFDRGELATEINTQSDAAFFSNASIVRLQTRLDGKVVNEKSFVGAYFVEA